MCQGLLCVFFFVSALFQSCFFYFFCLHSGPVTSLLINKKVLNYSLVLIVCVYYVCTRIYKCQFWNANRACLRHGIAWVQCQDHERLHKEKHSSPASSNLFESSQMWKSCVQWRCSVLNWLHFGFKHVSRFWLYNWVVCVLHFYLFICNSS